MCVIAVSRSGSRQPSASELRAMWDHNPHGAGYMFARGERVIIHKGFMDFSDFIRSVRSEHFTRSDSVVYHFRISTQAGCTPQMTHPFPVTRKLSLLRALDLSCPVGIAHNGIIPLTTDPAERHYSDTALFMSRYLSRLIRSSADLDDPRILNVIESAGGFSKFAFMFGDGTVRTVGYFTERDGILLSNTNHIYAPETDFSALLRKYSACCE